jgi:hypothetical protein
MQLAECQANTICRKWSSCTEACKEEFCQMRCGDVYKPSDPEKSKQIDKFSECVISGEGVKLMETIGAFARFMTVLHVIHVSSLTPAPFLAICPSPSRSALS